MNTLRQIGAITGVNLRSIPQRLGTSLVIIVGIAGVVAVLVSVLAMATGFLKTMNSTGRDDRAVVLRAGATSETTSVVERDAIDIIADAPGVKRTAGGLPVYSAEVVTVLLRPRKDGAEGSLLVRGVGADPVALRPEIKIVAGRMFEPTLSEVIVGRSAQELYEGLDVGGEIRRRNTVWKIVGVFESNGDAHESEVLTNNLMLQNAINWQGVFRGAVVMLESPAAFTSFKDALTSNPNLSVDVVTERQYFEEQSAAVAGMLQVVAIFIGAIMAIGAVFGALNAMYSAVNTRSIEIATLRALGFGAGPIVVSVMVEALLLAVIGGAVGALLSWLFFNGYTVNTSAVGTISANQTRAFRLVVDGSLMWTGIAWALSIGIIGGLLPAIRAARLPVATALRQV